MAFGVSVIRFPGLERDENLSTWHWGGVPLAGHLEQEEMDAARALNNEGFEILQTKGKNVLLAKRGEETRVIVTREDFSPAEWQLIGSSGEVTFPAEEKDATLDILNLEVLMQDVRDEHKTPMSSAMRVLLRLEDQVRQGILTDRDMKFTLYGILGKYFSMGVTTDILDKVNLRLMTPELGKPKV